MTRLMRLVSLFALVCSLAVPAAEPRELRPFDRNSLAAIRDAHTGRPFVLAFWSIYCEPCRDEMAQWRSLKRRYPDVPVVLVATDPPAERARIVQFLARYDPGPVETWAFADEFGERVRYAVDPAWRGELPRTYLYDAGHRAVGRSGSFEPHWIDSWLTRQGASRTGRK